MTREEIKKADKMKTAVEWLVNELKNNHGIDLTLYSEFDQAKEMEKEQMIELWNIAVTCESFEQYYNETFKSE
jgi:hypothetical protein